MATRRGTTTLHREIVRPRDKTPCTGSMHSTGMQLTRGVQNYMHSEGGDISTGADTNECPESTCRQKSGLIFWHLFAKRLSAPSCLDKLVL